ncbi:MAG TPA: tellurite resistance/C4-dicarboxylate transporter family protein, partial [Rhodanobacteraceae bacterium]|nr:tellurite resistance/C4-dicarboxylate transporter family protein [Rhodanobacteraceae bacterium]
MPTTPALPPSPLANLSPAYFGMVMATGIVSIGAWRLGLPTLAWVLFALNAAAYLLLWLLYGLRLWRYPERFIGDLTDHLRGPGFFTTVAATSIVGCQCVLLADNMVAGLVLWAFAILLWLALTYAIFAILTVKQEKPTLDKGISGGWLLAVVATQSIAVLSTLLAAHADQPYRMELNFLALSMWLWGGMLYIWIISLIFYRTQFLPLSPADVTPPYWINMGAMAISTLAGSRLVINAPEAPFLLALL